MIRNIFRTPEEKAVNYTKKIIAKINSYESLYSNLSDIDLTNKTKEFKQRLLSNKDTLDSLLPEAFAAVREASRRVLSQRHYDVQLLGGFVLHKGKIAEMKTGEGKTLVSVLAGYLNSLEGHGVHIVTVNPYLAQRDSEEMGKVYKFLDISVGCVLPNMENQKKQEAYNCDVTYITHSELGFDYLRDNMKINRSDMCQRGLNFAIIDEVDSILIDEARTPLIISGQGTDMSSKILYIHDLIKIIDDEKYWELDLKTKNIHLHEPALVLLEKQMIHDGVLDKAKSLYDNDNLFWMSFIEQALKAKIFYHLNKEYVINDGLVNIVDEHTGRVLSGRRYGKGLHQAIEAKENVVIQVENETQATVTYQNFFKMYKKLSGMTGTAFNDKEEFVHIYGLEVVPIKTNKPVVRVDNHDEIYKTIKEKDSAIVDRIIKSYQKGQPVLVGTESVDKSVQISHLLEEKKIPHNVLNAKFHAMESEIVAQAGKPYAVTITTNMAGRGTDIKLGGNLNILKNSLNELEDHEKEVRYKELEKEVIENEKLVKDLGGLLVIGTSRHDSRRIDLQLRGRSGRQGDPGETVFMISAEDDLILRFGTKLKSWLERIGLPDGVPISHPFMSKSVEKAQKKVENFYSDQRKELLKYDDIIDKQRKAFYKERIDIIDDNIDIFNVLENMDNLMIEKHFDMSMPEKSFPEQWDLEGLSDNIFKTFKIRLPIVEMGSKEGIDRNILEGEIKNGIKEYRKWKLFELNDENKKKILKENILNIMDKVWKDHLVELDTLKEGIGLRSYGQRNPLYEWAKDASMYFMKLYDYISLEVSEKISTIDFRKPNNLYNILKNDFSSNQKTNVYNVMNKTVNLSISSMNSYYGYQNII